MDATDFPISSPYLSQRFQSLIWSLLDSDLARSAIFYAERYFAMNQSSHEARHLYATALLRGGQTYSALCVVDISREQQCSGCLEMKAKCCTALGRYRQARECLEEALPTVAYAPSVLTPARIAHFALEEASMHSRSGTMALKGNLHEQAAQSFRNALALDHLIWEAFEGLCALGNPPEVDELFPPKPRPVKRMASDSHPPKNDGPVATGAGFFTPDVGSGTGHIFRGRKPDISQPQPFRIAPPAGSRDSIASTDFPFPIVDTTFHQIHRTSRSQPVIPTSTQQHITRPLSSADEAGPIPKKLRSAAVQPEPGKPIKTLKAAGEDISRKGLNTKSSSLTKANQSSASNVRRSTRLQSTSGSKQAKPSNNRRRPPVHGRSKSIESEMDDDTEGAYPPSPPAVANTPRSEGSASPSNWTPTNEAGAQQAYDIEVADYYIYDLMRLFARATRALTMYDSAKCLAELEELPSIHQQTPWVLAMVGRAHYEKADYVAAERAFKAVRTLEPYRVWDMEVYSTLLWHLQRPVQLSFLAQELISIDPRSAQAWIAVGNLFSLQKERPQALTCFRRAFQMDPACAYAFTLSGHESIDEDPDKAINFFQSALRVDPRHYNAWYGLGTCYLRMSKLRLAEYHFRRAAEIHPNNAVLLGCVGMVVERRGDREGAHTLFDEAVKLAPENALVRYRRAKVYISMKKYESAIGDLEHLRSTSPEESNVVFQLAKVYRLVGDEVKSAQLLAIARDISPKSMGKIKKLLETVKDEASEDKMDEG
ncbi:20s cyclosome subunit (nuc2 cdc27) [Moniliophthora roreri MCA 2997]|uniref:20s cyclosome subunit ( nuc2 cdc27) n=2 Tax=Moniliophthora roreri TaxID=221103 RepID=V2XVM0_MONRO|nr:20s cyclosome subunit (nuc2 cdc27) [Moniliophthora roreri MCA 2997]KAI3610717.1 20s cyclosome subunit (nuc2 cdc27) [Moniliophthora roreri]